MRKLTVFDLETFENFFLAAFKRIEEGKLLTVSFSDRMSERNKVILDCIMREHTLIGYNSNNFDIPILCAAVYDNWSAKDIMQIVSYIIDENKQGWQAQQHFALSQPPWLDTIDLMMVNPSSAQKPPLKTLGARLHSRKLQDLPLPPGTILTDEQKVIITDYCENDLDTTIDLYHELKPRLDLREEIGAEWGELDLRSKSDAQIAEAYMRQQFPHAKKKIPRLEEGHIIRYEPPAHIEFQTPALKRVLEIIKRRHFRLDEYGKIKFPKRFTRLTKTTIGNTTYKLGIGGLHSQESCISHIASDKVKLIDRDMSSYYPNMIINYKLYPKHLGKRFLTLYKEIVDSRLAAKKAGNKLEAESKKIVINGGFGKFGSSFSVLFSPKLLLQTTISGQLNLLMIIEALELAGFSVVSANTDGFVTKVPVERESEFFAIGKHFEQLMMLELDATYYRALYSQNVNHYLAITTDGKIKQKGCFAHSSISKSLAGDVIVDAAIAYLTEGADIEQTIKACKDVRRFLCDRRVTGGASWRGQELGKMVRWYYSTNGDTIHYTENGNKVAKTEGAVPMMQLKTCIPDDIDYPVYVNETIKLLKSANAIEE